MSMLSKQKLLGLYRSYIGEPESERDVYVGFGLFLCGIVLAIVALALFLSSSTLEVRSDAYFAWVEPAYALGMLSLPAVMLGIVVLLPSERRVLAVSMLGALVTIGATGGFLYAYPSDWNFYGDNYTVPIVATYAVGLAGIAASTGAALIAHYLDLARQVAPSSERDADEKEHYTDEEIARDIDEAMENVELSWGGVEKSDNTPLTFTEHEFADADIGEAGVTKTRSTGVQSQVAGLKGMKSGEAMTQLSGENVDEQTAKLLELREQKQPEQLASAGGGLRGRIRTRVSRTTQSLRSKVGAVRRRVRRK